MIQWFEGKYIFISADRTSVCHNMRQSLVVVKSFLQHLPLFKQTMLTFSVSMLQHATGFSTRPTRLAGNKPTGATVTDVQKSDAAGASFTSSP